MLKIIEIRAMFISRGTAAPSQHGDNMAKSDINKEKMASSLSPEVTSSREEWHHGQNWHHQRTNGIIMARSDIIKSASHDSLSPFVFTTTLLGRWREWLAQCHPGSFMAKQGFEPGSSRSNTTPDLCIFLSLNACSIFLPTSFHLKSQNNLHRWNNLAMKAI